MKTFAAFSFAVILSMSLFTGCKKDKDDNNGLPAGKTMKFTVNTSNLLATDDFDITFGGGDVQGSATTAFKVNGVARSNQRTITITNEELRVGEIVVETATPLYTVIVTPGGSSSTVDHSFSFTINAIVDGKAQPTISKTIGYDVYTEGFTF